RGTADRRALLRRQLCAFGRLRHVVVSRAEHRDPCRRRAGALRPRPAHAAHAAAAPAVRRFVDGARLPRRAAVGGASAPNPGGHLHRPAHRIADGALPAADCVLRDSSRRDLPPKGGSHGTTEWAPKGGSHGTTEWAPKGGSHAAAEPEPEDGSHNIQEEDSWLPPSGGRILVR